MAEGNEAPWLSSGSVRGQRQVRLRAAAAIPADSYTYQWFVGSNVGMIRRGGKKDSKTTRVATSIHYSKQIDDYFFSSMGCATSAFEVCSNYNQRSGSV